MSVIKLGADLALTWSLSPKQYDFVLDEETRNLIFGGARGGGKSFAVRCKAIYYAYKYPGIKQLIIRRTLDELRNNHITPMLGVLGRAVRYIKAEKTMVFPNGSTIQFGYFDSDNDYLRYHGLEVDVLYVDEATLLKEDWLRKLDSIVRGVNAYPKQTIWTCNPGGEGHAYVRRVGIDRVYEPGEEPERYRFIPALVTDNRALIRSMPGYVSYLLSLPYKLRRAWLNGDWSVMEGMYFDDFVDRPEYYQERRYTHVIPYEGFRLPEHYKIFRAFDWGYNKPFASLWCAVSEDDVVYVIAELYGVKRVGGIVQPDEGVRWTRERVFAEIQRFEREHPLLAGRKVEYGVADPAIWDAQYGVSTAEVASKYGLHYIKGDHARIPGWLQVHYRLQMDESGYPRLYVLDSCRDFIRTIQTLVYDEHNPEDLDSKGEDHAADALRYFLMSRPCKPLLRKPDKRTLFAMDPLDQYKQRRR